MNGRFSSVIFSYLIGSIFVFSTHGQGVGVITVDPIDELSLNAPDGELLVTLVAINSSSSVEVKGLVDVTCNHTDSNIVTGYTYASFAPALYNSSEVSTGLLKVLFRLLSSGRANDVRCEANTRGNIAQPQFVDTVSDIVSIHGLTPPRLYFPSSPISIQNDGGWTGDVTLTLSVTAKSNITVFCNSTTTQNSTDIEFTPKLVTAGATRVKMYYSIARKDYNSTSLDVNCFAQSNTGNQYLYSTSAATASFTLDQGSAEIYPPDGTISSTSLQATLSLDRVVESVVQFSCHVGTFDSALDASRYPVDECPQPESKNRPATTTTTTTTVSPTTDELNTTGIVNSTTASSTMSSTTTSGTSTTTTSGSTSTMNSTTTNTDTVTSNVTEAVVTVDVTGTNSTTLSEITAECSPESVMMTEKAAGGDYCCLVWASGPTETTTTTTTPATTTTTAVQSTTATITTTTTDTSTTTTTVPTTTTTVATTSTTSSFMTTPDGFQPLDTTTWQLISPSNTTLRVQAKTREMQFEVARRSIPAMSVREYLVLSCCAVEGESEERYGGVSAISRIEFDYSYSQPVNLSVIQAGATILQNPAYVNLAPCPCDLTRAACDVECYCDTDCSEENKSLFSRNISGLFGGEVPLPADHMCSRNNRIGAPDWSPFLCTQFENNAYLGHFHPLQSRITERDQLPGLSENSYRQPEFALSLPDGLAVGYQKDSWINRYSGGFLAIPQATYNGMCTDTFPVRYLRDLDSSCTMIMEQKLCTDTLSRLNIANYLQSTNNNYNPAPFQTVTELLRKHGRTNEIVPVESHFTCTDRYSSQSKPMPVQSSDYLFNTSNTESTSEATTYCIWDDGQTYPPSPSLDGNTCLNAVVDVSYDIEYNNSAILKIVATYVMADIPLEKSEIISYSRYWYEEDSSSNDTEDVNNSTTMSSFLTSSSPMEIDRVLPLLSSEEAIYTSPPRPVQFAARYRVTFTPTGLAKDAVKYSGKPGYNMDSALNTMTQDITNVTTLIAEPQPTLPKPGADGLCEHADTEPLTFSSNQMSQCQLVVTLQDLIDCDSLRLAVYQKMESLFPVIKDGVYMSRFGVPDYKRTSQWIDIFRNIPPYNATEENTTSTTVRTTTNTATDMPLASIDPVTPAPRLSIQGECTGVSTAAHLTVMYALSGRSAGAPIYVIVGARVQVTETDWSFHCSYDDCNNSTVDRFPLTFTTEYIEVPSATPPLVSRYEKKTQDECRSCDPPWTLESFLYPVAGTELPKEVRAENLAMFLLLLASLVVFWGISRPWSHKHYLIV